MGLLLGTRYLALQGASREQLRPARRLLVFSSLMTLALNVTAQLIAGQVGKAAFDAVGPLLLIGWAEVGPGLLQAMCGVEHGQATAPAPESEGQKDAVPRAEECDKGVAATRPRSPAGHDQRTRPPSAEDDPLKRARQEDAGHREVYQRPISAETLRKQLRVGAARSRTLVAMVRADNSHSLGGEAERASRRGIRVGK